MGSEMCIRDRNRVGAPEYDAYNVLSQEDREVAQLDKVPSIPSSLMIKHDRHRRNTLVQ